MSFRACIWALVICISATELALAQSEYVNFEGAQTNPIRLSADGTRLFAVNTPGRTLSVFSLESPGAPSLISEIPVGLEPVSVNPRTPDEVWVVNQVSDSVSVVSLSLGAVIDTIRAKDEPMDVVFAGGLAFVSISRRNRINVYDAEDRNLVAEIPVLGNNPRAMAVSEDGSKVYAAFALSGNRTTIINHLSAPPQPPPTNPDLPEPPLVGLIVDATDPDWSEQIQFTMPDNDIVEINVDTLEVGRYYSGLGTINLGLAVRPGSGELFLANTDARNLVRFEPVLRGHFADNRITRVLSTGLAIPYDLNAGIDYETLPNPQAKATALAQPTAIAFAPGGRSFYVASFGTDRVALVNFRGEVLSRIEVGSGTPGVPDPRNKRGPRGLAITPNGLHLYSLNRISNTISVINAQLRAVVREIPVGTFDPTPQAIREGRGFLYDALLSGNGTASCASCHIDADMDMLAWDLGDPGGEMAFVRRDDFEFALHPMKGPMTTQSLRGLKGLEPLHWRGDRADFHAFNPAFDALMGGDQLSPIDMDAYTAFIETIVYQPNPFQNLDRSLRVLGEGDAAAGRDTFLNEFYDEGIKCNTCHVADPGPGSDRLIVPPRPPQQPQPLKTPQLRNMYQKRYYNPVPGGVSINGFGYNSDGVMPNLGRLVAGPVFKNFVGDLQKQLNLVAFLLSFDTGMAPAVGYSVTMRQDNLAQQTVATAATLLVEQAAVGNIDLIADGVLEGINVHLLYEPSGKTWQLESDETSATITTAQLLLAVVRGGTVTLMGVAPGSGPVFSGGD